MALFLKLKVRSHEIVFFGLFVPSYHIEGIQLSVMKAMYKGLQFNCSVLFKPIHKFKKSQKK